MKNKETLERGITITHVGKQETLEEVDENKKNLYYYKQVMNPYPVEEYSHTAYEKGFIEGYQESTKWQQERSYSEEDVKNAFLDGWQLRDGDLPFPKAKKKWFNEFKNK